MVMPHCTETKNLLLVRLCPAKVKNLKKKYTCNDAKWTELFFPLQSLFYPVQYIGLYITEMILSIIENCNWASHFRRIRLWFSFIELYLFFKVKFKLNKQGQKYYIYTEITPKPYNKKESLAVREETGEASQIFSGTSSLNGRGLTANTHWGENS